MKISFFRNLLIMRNSDWIRVVDVDMILEATMDESAIHIVVFS